MLKQIIFILKTDVSEYMKTIVADIDYLSGIFLEYGVQVSYLAEADGGVDLQKLYNAPTGEDDILFITDDAEILDKMLVAGHYTIALQHDYNQRADLYKALYAMSEIRNIDFDSFLKAYERLAGLPWRILETERLTIRETTIDDVDDFYRIYSDPLITRHMDPLYGDINEEKAYAAEYIKTIYSFYGYGIWTVALRGTSEVIGRAGISWREGYRYPELGFIIAHSHQRLGYAEEALRAILELAKDELEFDTIQVLIQPQNYASINLCHKLGFELKGSDMLNDQEHLLLIYNF
ncbi:MAG: GNAT family N-acetyltransferase [Lachnospiraceae bacterium]|nr:GNAT family N-acetyltransferase [Lachnospiraceae bacterium]